MKGGTKPFGMFLDIFGTSNYALVTHEITHHTHSIINNNNNNNNNTFISVIYWMAVQGAWGATVY